MAWLVEARDLCFSYGRDRGSRGPAAPLVLDHVDLQIESGARVGIVGESGSGKSTLVRVLCGLLSPLSGSVTFDRRELSQWRKDGPMGFRSRNQMVFQSPASSLDPRMRVERAIAEPVKAIEGRSPSRDEIVSWLSEVHLGPEMLRRYPHQLSGGQLQRIAVGRALSLRPDVLYADEPTSALDVSVQAQVLNLLMELRDRLGLTLVMVSHDLAVISRLCEYVVVMKDGRVVEQGPTVQVLRTPSNEYTARLVGAARAVSLVAS